MSWINGKKGRGPGNARLFLFSNLRPFSDIFGLRPNIRPSDGRFVNRRYKTITPLSKNASNRLRVAHLRKVPARVRFLSCEPLLGPLQLNLDGIHWVIVGGESGPGARPLDGDWVREIRDQCIKKRVAFFFKQWGGVRKDKTGRMLDGRTWDEMPSGL